MLGQEGAALQWRWGPEGAQERRAAGGAMPGAGAPRAQRNADPSWPGSPST